MNATATTTATTATKLTPASKALFVSLVGDAPNWSGSPLVVLSASERGNLTNLKRRGFVTTDTYEGDSFVSFTEKGVQLAAELGIAGNLAPWYAAAVFTPRMLAEAAISAASAATRTHSSASKTTMTCRVCDETKPVAKFPTTGRLADDGTMLRNTRCRACRDSK